MEPIDFRPNSLLKWTHELPQVPNTSDSVNF